MIKFNFDAAQTQTLIDALAQAIGENRGHRFDAIAVGSDIASDFTRQIDKQISLRNILCKELHLNSKQEG
jgi:hypothetical protein